MSNYLPLTLQFTAVTWGSGLWGSDSVPFSMGDPGYVCVFHQIQNIISFKIYYYFNVPLRKKSDCQVNCDTTVITEMF